MVLTTKELFEYLLIFLVVLWPVWVLAFVFLRLFVLKIGSLVTPRKTTRSAVRKHSQDRRKSGAQKAPWNVIGLRENDRVSG